MAGKAGFWDRLFSRGGDKASDALTRVQGKEVQNELSSEYGIEILGVNVPKAELMQNGFRRMRPEELARASAALQYIPQLATLSAQGRAVGRAFQAATANTYRVHLAPGAHLARSTQTTGALRGIGLSNTTNQVCASAELIPNQATFKPPLGPQIALSIFSVASLATGQYFMSQINGRLEAISDGIQRIERFLEDGRRSELTAAQQELREQAARMEYLESERDISEMLAQLNRIRMAARKHIPHYRAQIQAMIAEIDPKDKVEAFERKVLSLSPHLQEYRCAVQIVAMTKMLELRVKNIAQADQLSMYRREIADCVETYKADYAAGRAAFVEYLEHGDRLNKESVRQKIVRGLSSVAELSVSPMLYIAVNEKTERKINDFFDGRRNRKKARSTQTVAASLEYVGGMDELDSLISSVDDYMRVLAQPIEIVCAEGEHYINLPAYNERAAEA